MRVLFIASEVFPLIKTGGLADVAAALPAALARRGYDMRLLVPGYPAALATAASARTVMSLGDPLGCGETRILETALPDSGIRVWLVDCPQIFSRDGGAYQDSDGRDWPDNHLRFGLLNHVAARIAGGQVAKWSPDIVHANDWHAGLAPMLIGSLAHGRPATVFTIHNLAYQGLFPLQAAEQLALPRMSGFDLEFYGRLSFIKAGIQFADAITTVSPTYAKEILTPEFGCGLDGLLRERVSRLSGILNGVDYSIWDPATDRYLPHNYGLGDVAPKTDCKADLQRELGLDCNETTPIACFMSRIVHQKMPDLVLEALPALVERGMQFALVGDGERVYEDGFREMQQRFPGRVSVRIGYREDLAHRMLAGADILLHPARFEPCGLVPLYAMRYGTIPVACRKGGMADSIVDTSQTALRNGTATGFCFDNETPDGLLACLDRVSDLYRQPLAWRKLQANAMHKDFGWGNSAKAYDELYRGLVGVRADEAGHSHSKRSA